MQRYILLYRLFAGLILLLLAASFAGPVLAQERPAAGAASAQRAYPLYMGVYHVKPEMEASFELLIRNEVVPALRKAGTKDYSFWQNATLGESFTYVETAPLTSIAEFDNPHPFVKALGQKGAEALWAKMARCINSYRARMITIRPDLGVEAKPGYVSKLVVQVNTTVTPGRNAEYEKNGKLINTAASKAGAKGVQVAQVGLGGNPNEYTAIYQFDSFGDMERFMQPFGKALAEAKLEPQTGVLTNIEYLMYRYRPELSIQAPAEAAP
jgi:hypothetical protein